MTRKRVHYGGVGLWEVKIAIFLCGWDHDKYIVYKDIHLWEVSVGGESNKLWKSRRPLSFPVYFLEIERQRKEKGKII